MITKSLKLIVEEPKDRKEFSFPYIPSGLFRGKSEQVYIYFVNMICCLKLNVVYTDDNLGKED